LAGWDLGKAGRNSPKFKLSKANAQWIDSFKPCLALPDFLTPGDVLEDSLNAGEPVFRGAKGKTSAGPAPILSLFNPPGVDSQTPPADSAKSFKIRNRNL
jgi:hypothetical protein